MGPGLTCEEMYRDWRDMRVFCNLGGRSEYKTEMKGRRPSKHYRSTTARAAAAATGSAAALRVAEDEAPLVVSLDLALVAACTALVAFELWALVVDDDDSDVDDDAGESEESETESESELVLVPDDEPDDPDEPEAGCSVVRVAELPVSLPSPHGMAGEPPAG